MCVGIGMGYKTTSYSKCQDSHRPSHSPSLFPQSPGMFDIPNLLFYVHIFLHQPHGYKHLPPSHKHSQISCCEYTLKSVPDIYIWAFFKPTALSVYLCTTLFSHVYPVSCKGLYGDQIIHSFIHQIFIYLGHWQMVLVKQADLIPS